MKKALVIGGGVAGPVVAMALRQVGMEAVVHEAYAVAAHGVGSGLALSTNGLSALQQLDAHKAVREVGYPLDRGVMHLGDGRLLGGDATGTPLSDGTTTVSLRRADLYAALTAQALDRGVRIEYGKRLVGVSHQRDQVTAEFADGTRASSTRSVARSGNDGLSSFSPLTARPPLARSRGLLPATSGSRCTRWPRRGGGPATAWCSSVTPRT
ncbi:FAD-dependent oxidoreductase [Amycolatopsis sp. H20-H5]|uniref:FAD-dependent oxidoreductase n=1 Tax=Amycolatopsis sp. H20-H5 TaxID=3046309 RepID=UPI002DB92349|nr:FAD-dependent monooxygenase [Amycolatopsis sp. H20-H5]MEC3974107.1 FAD-dependent monooxygenase [Amycolatopsis sp. H20-H5]